MRNRTSLPAVALAALLLLVASGAAARAGDRAALHELALSQIEAEDYAGAIESLQDLSGHCPRSIGVSNNLGVALAASGDHAAGLRELGRLSEQFATADPATVDAVRANRQTLVEAQEFWQDKAALPVNDVLDLTLLDAIDACLPPESPPAAATVGEAPASPAAAPGSPATAEPGDDEEEPDPVEAAALTALVDWVAAWQGRQADDYVNSYSDSFVPADGASRSDWEARKRGRIGNADFIEVIIGDEADPGEVDVTKITDTVARTRFRQTYRSNSFADRVNKTLVFALEDGRWKIISETAEQIDE